MASFSYVVVLLLLVYNWVLTIQARWFKGETGYGNRAEPLTTYRDSHHGNNDWNYSWTLYSTLPSLSSGIIPLTNTSQQAEAGGTAAVPPEELSGTNTTAQLQRRDCKWNTQTSKWDCDPKLPGLYKMINQYRDTMDQGRATAERSVWFYNNLPVSSQQDRQRTFGTITGLLSRSGVDTYSVFDGINPHWRVAQDQYTLDNDDQIKAANPALKATDDPIDVFHHCLFQAAAMAALHADAYLFTPADSIWDEDSVWARVEYPALTRNPNIMRIYRVDPRPESPFCGRRIVLWDRDRGDPPHDLGFLCPILSHD